MCANESILCPVCMWNATVLTLFPDVFPGPLAHSISGKALDKQWTIRTIDMRDFATDKHKTVDDTPFGGGAGMVIKADIVDQALTHALTFYDEPPAIVYMSPRGEPLKQKRLRSLVETSPAGVIIVCGRYEGIDQRVLDKWRESHGLLEISLGDYILSGGEVAALTFMDGIIRLIDGVTGKTESLDNESFELDILEHSHYTKPRLWKDRAVPDVLLSGHHGKIKQWQRQNALEITQERRPDLLADNNN